MAKRALLRFGASFWMTWLERTTCAHPQTLLSEELLIERAARLQNDTSPGKMFDTKNGLKNAKKRFEKRSET